MRRPSLASVSSLPLARFRLAGLVSRHIHGRRTRAVLCFCHCCNFSITWMIYSFVVTGREDRRRMETCESGCVQCQGAGGLSGHGRPAFPFLLIPAPKHQMGILDVTVTDLLFHG